MPTRSKDIILNPQILVHLILFGVLLFAPVISAAHQVAMIDTHDTVEISSDFVSEPSSVFGPGLKNTDETDCGIAMSCHAPVLLQTTEQMPLGPIMSGANRPDPDLSMVGIAFDPATPPPLALRV